MSSSLTSSTSAVVKLSTELPFKTQLPDWMLNVSGVRVGKSCQAAIPPLRPPLTPPYSPMQSAQSDEEVDEQEEDDEGGAASTEKSNDGWIADKDAKKKRGSVPSLSLGSSSNTSSSSASTSILSTSTSASSSSSSSSSSSDPPPPVLDSDTRASIKAYFRKQDPPCLGPYMAGYPLWQPKHVEDSRSVGKILGFSKGAFHEDDAGTFSLQDPSRALFLLHSLNYSTDEALALLRPLEPEEEDEEEDPNQDTFPGDDLCYLCRDGGNILLCDNNGCCKVYHPECLHMDKLPPDSWQCPHHFCHQCKTPFGEVLGQGLPKQSPSASSNSTTSTSTSTSSSSQQQQQSASGKPQVPAMYCTTCTTAYCVQHIPTRLPDKLAALGIREFMCSRCADKEVHASGSKGKHTGRHGFMRRLVTLKQRIQDPLQKAPSIGKTELDLYTFYCEVIKLGGIAQVIRTKAWAGVKKELGLPLSGPLSTDLDLQLANHYLSILYPYERRHVAGAIPITPRDLGYDVSSLYCCICCCCICYCCFIAMRG